MSSYLETHRDDGDFYCGTCKEVRLICSEGYNGVSMACFTPKFASESNIYLSSCNIHIASKSHLVFAKSVLALIVYKLYCLYFCFFRH